MVAIRYALSTLGTPTAVCAFGSRSGPSSPMPISDEFANDGQPGGSTQPRPHRREKFPLRVVGPVPEVWSSEGVSSPAWHVTVFYDTYEQTFWFANEPAATAYASKMSSCIDRPA